MNDDWRDWIEGKYDNRYKGVKNPYRRGNKKRNIAIIFIIIAILGMGYILADEVIKSNKQEDRLLDAQNPETQIIDSVEDVNTDKIDHSKNYSISLIENVTKPTYEELINYALNLINEDRAKHGLAPVSLGNNIAAQKHAEDMLKYRYISHWDSEGYKPYMRYTEYNGRGEVSENASISGYLDLGVL